jgi:hypothetical protein
MTGPGSLIGQDWPEHAVMEGHLQHQRRGGALQLAQRAYWSVCCIVFALVASSSLAHSRPAPPHSHCGAVIERDAAAGGAAGR